MYVCDSQREREREGEGEGEGERGRGRGEEGERGRGGQRGREREREGERERGREGEGERESRYLHSQRECAHSQDRGKDGQCGCNECMCSTDSFYFNGTCHPIVSLDTVTEVSQ